MKTGTTEKITAIKMSGIFVVPDRPMIGIKTSLTTLKK